MQLNWTDRISFKLARTAVIIAFVVGFALSAGQVYLDYLEEGDILDRKVQESLKVAENAAARSVLMLDADLAQEVIAGLLVYDYVIEVSISDDLGKDLASSRKSALDDSFAGEGLARSFITDTSVHRRTLELPEAMRAGPGMLRVVIDRAVGLQPFFARATTTFVSGLVRNLVLVMLLYIAFHRALAKPMSQMVAEISAIDPEHPGEQRIRLHHRHAKDEVGMLAQQINMAFDAVQVLIDNLRSTNKALSASEDNLRRRSWELEQEVERTKKTSMELLITKEQAEAANRAKSVFLANVSHELRTPLNAIIGFSSIMSDQLFGPIGHDKYREYLRDIRSSSEHLSDVLGEVLDLAKIEAGQVEVEEEFVDVTRMLGECQALISSQASKKGLRVKLDLEDNLPEVYGDRLRLKQSVLNLLTNAVKFTPDRGKDVQLCARMTDQGTMEIIVKDHGIGIPAEEQEIIFAPFVRSSSALNRSHEGTGLGLSLVRAFIDLHDGDISVDSNRTNGTTFIITLPPERIGRKARSSQREASSFI